MLYRDEFKSDIMEKFLRIIVLCTTVLFLQTLKAQTWQWANSLGNPEGNIVINGMAKMSNDEIVAVGYFDVPSITIGNDVLVGTGINNMVCILNKKGEYRKVIKFGSNSDYRPISVASDKEDNIYLAGDFSDLLFYVGNDSLVNQGGSDAFVIKLDRNLNIIWTKTFATAFNDELNKINIDKDGNILVAGTSANTSGSDIIYTTFLTKIAPDKSILWTKKGTSNYEIYTKSILIDNDNNYYWIGESSDLILEDGYSLEDTTTWNYGFIIKYSSSSERLDIKRLPSILNAYLKDQTFYIVQRVYDSVDYNIAGIRTLKYDISFESIWQSDIMKIQPGYFLVLSNDEINISVDNQGSVYLFGGLFGDSVVFAQDTLTEIKNENSNVFNIFTGVYLFKYNKDGEEVWAKKTGDKLTNNGTAILVDGEDDLIIAGIFQDDTLQFGDFNVYNDNKIDTSYWIHGHMILSKPIYSYIASFGKIKTGILEFKTFQTQLYPNPVSDVFTLVSPIISNKKGLIEIYDINGRLVKMQRISSGENNIQINVQNLATGMHLLHLYIDEQHSIQKFMKQ